MRFACWTQIGYEKARADVWSAYSQLRPVHAQRF